LHTEKGFQKKRRKMDHNAAAANNKEEENVKEVVLSDARDPRCTKALRASESRSCKITYNGMEMQGKRFFQQILISR
jgi:hypothetical protein